MGLWPSGSPLRKVWPAIASGGLAFCLYLRSLAPGVLSYDFAEFQYLPAKLGLPHPNGFPFYMLLGWLWSKLPIGSLAFRMNLLSGVAGGMAVAVFSLLLRELSGRDDAALAGAFFLALMPSFRLYSSGAERYTLLALLLLASFLEGARWEKGGKPRCLVLSALSMGLALATHPAAFPILPFWLFYLALSSPPRLLSRSSLPALAALILPLSLYLYIPWRWLSLARYPIIPELGASEAPYRGLAFVWYRPELSLKLLWEYTAGLGSYGFSLMKGGWKEAISSVGETKGLWLAEFPLPFWPLAFAGCISLLLARPKFWLSSLGLAWTDLLITVYIKQGKPEAYLLPAFVIFALWLGLGVGVFARAWERVRLPGWALAGLLASLLFTFCRAGDPSASLSRFAGVERWWREVLSYPLEKGSALMAHWGDLTPMWYLQQAEGIRTDLIGLYPPAGWIASRWLSGGRALYLAGPTHGFDPGFPAGFRLMPWGKLLRLYPDEASLSCPDGLAPAPEPQGWPFKVEGWKVSGENGLLELCWEALEDFPADLYLSVRVLSRDGVLIRQKDEPLLPQWYPHQEVKGGEKGLFITGLELPGWLAPGNYRVELVLFALKEGGWEEVAPSPYSPGEFQVAHPLPRLEEGDRVLLLKPGAGPFRVAAFRVSEKPVRPGDPVRLEVVWEASQAPGADCQVAFRIRDVRGVVRVTEPQPLSPGYPTALWREGEKVRVIYDLRAPRRISGRAFWVEPVLLCPGRGERPVPLHAGPFFVRDRPHLWKMPEGAKPVGVKFGELAELAGYTLEEGEELKLVLYWKVLSETDKSCWVFVHLVDEGGRIVAQHDGIPSGGAHPTSLWIAGEVIEDPHILRGDLPPGRYTILVGLYDPKTMERLRVEAPGNAFPLAVIERGGR